jgi:hypothetical protein
VGVLVDVEATDPDGARSTTEATVVRRVVGHDDRIPRRPVPAPAAAGVVWPVPAAFRLCIIAGLYRRFICALRPIDLGLLVAEPVLRPDAVKPPTETL